MEAGAAMTEKSHEQATGLRVRWLGRADERVREDLKTQFTDELEHVFPQNLVSEITVHDCLAGYSAHQEKKVVFGVEVRAGKRIQTHMVKLGVPEEVGADHEGWSRCTANRYIGGRIFVRVELKMLSQNRAAVIYENAYTLFGLDQETQYPKFLDDVTWWSIADDKPDPKSVERVISQVYGVLYRWFYTTAQTDPEATRAFYERRLAKALPQWSSQRRRLWDMWKLHEQKSEATERLEELRGDALWLLGGLDRPESTAPPNYLDPYDYLCWAFEQDETTIPGPGDNQDPTTANGKLPPTLIGRSHGDLHGRNILVGHQRGEVEFPVVIDYGEMDTSNVLVWDFVKLEMELKTRILPRLYNDAAARETVLTARHAAKKPPRDAAPSATLDPDERDRADRARRLAFFYEFEHMLALETSQIHSEQDAESREPPGQKREFFKSQKVDRALAILVRIRQEAALGLGYRQDGRHSRWLEEYQFALAVYGLGTVKWANYTVDQIESALVSSGVAAARLRSARTALRDLHGDAAEPPRNGPSYRIVLAAAHGKLNARDLKGAHRLIKEGRADFPHAIPLRTELALVLAEQTELNAAVAVVEPLRRLCWVFGDFETLTRVARALKNLGDLAWAGLGDPAPTPPESSAPWQYYKEAFRLYRDAFQIAGTEHFPGVNAATLALLIGDETTSRKLAGEVAHICANTGLSSHGEDLYWLLVTEGETALLSGDPDREKRAGSYYDLALSRLAPSEIRMAKSSWDQICRLWRALGASKVDPVVAVFKKHEKLGPLLGAGPMGDCGLDGKRYGAGPAPS
jgi:hypothetical protein